MEAILAAKGAIVKDNDKSAELIAKGYGEKAGEGVLLSPEETVFMLEKKKDFTVKDARGKKYAYDALLRQFSAKDNDFGKKYLVFRDLRSRGFCVKPGFRGESQYRVYSRGDKPASAQAEWLVKCVTEESTFSFPQLDREIHAAQAIRKKTMYAISDKEGDMTYYVIDKAKP